MALVTGGEPLAQEASLGLLTSLCDQGYPTSIETSGALPIDAVDPRVKIVMDLKCPGSGMSHRNRLENIPLLKPFDEVKLVIADRRDFDWASAMIETHRLGDRVEAVLLSPVFGVLDPRVLSEWILELRPAARIHLQLHKILGIL